MSYRARNATLHARPPIWDDRSRCCISDTLVRAHVKFRSPALSFCYLVDMDALPMRLCGRGWLLKMLGNRRDLGCDHCAVELEGTLVSGAAEYNLTEMRRMCVKT